jgi:dTDP-4-amino-4,6-dideoxygalactose transaminase
MITFFKGRVALFAILKAMGIGPGDEIILPGFTCVVVPNAIMYLGANPIYVDIASATYNIDPDKIEEKITARTRAIIAQHTFGIPADMDRICATARKYNLYVIEDSCHAIGSKYNGRDVGTFGDAAFFSSQWSKPVTTGLGGWAVINNDTLLENMKTVYSEFINPSQKEKILLRLQYLAYKKLFTPSLFWFAQNTYRRLSSAGIMLGSSSNEELQSRMPADYKKKMTSWQRKLLGQNLAEIERINSHRREVASLYETILREKGMKAAVNLAEGYEPIYLRYPVRVRHKNAMLEKAKKMRIEIGDWFLSPVHPNLEGWEKVGYTRGACPNAEMVCDHIINLPTHQGIGIKEVKKIVELFDHQDAI